MSEIERLSGAVAETTQNQETALDPLESVLLYIEESEEAYPINQPRLDHTIAARRASAIRIVEETFKQIAAADISPEDKARLLASTARVFSAIEHEDGVSEHHLNSMRAKYLPAVLGTRRLTRVHREVAKHLLNRDELPYDAIIGKTLNDKKFPHIAELPEDVRIEVLEHLKTKAYITEVYDEEAGTSSFRLPKKNRKRAVAALTEGHVGTGVAVAGLYDDASGDEIIGIDRARELFSEHDEAREVKKISIATYKDSYKILPINEARIGHQDSHDGIDFAWKELERATAMDDHDKPDVVIFSNMIQGEFTHTKSGRRPVLTTGINRNSTQFALAHDLLQSARKIDAPVILNLGPDDRTIAHDYTIGVISEMQAAMKNNEDDASSGGVSAIDSHTNYYQRNKIQQDPMYQKHLKFQLDYVLPLCYRLGRTLRSADDVAQLTNGEVHMSEYLLLYAHIQNGSPLPDELDIDPGLIVAPGESDANGLIAAYNFDIDFETTSRTARVQYRHNTGLTAESLVNNHMDTPLKQQGNLGFMGEEIPDLFLTGRAQELTYATASHVPVTSLPGLSDPIKSLSSDGYYSDAPGDTSRRFNATRRRLVKPAIDTIEIDDNGTVTHHIATGKILEKSRHLPRMAIFVFSDFQTGSPTARADHQVKFLSMVLDAAKEMPVAIHFAGDIIHGNVYANMAYEAQSIGLMRPESQKIALSDMLRKVYEQAPQPLINNVVDVLVQQGNHDEVQRVKSFGNANHDSNIDYLLRDSRDLFDTPGEPTKVRHDAVFLTPEGTPVNTWVGRSHYGPFSINTAHYHLDRFAKGDGSGIAAYHALQRARNLGSSETPDMFIGAHWHNEQLTLAGDVLSIVNGSIADRSEFEDRLGYNAQVAGTIIKLGGGEPISVSFIHDKALIDQQVKHGYFTQESLNDHGFYDDKHFDPYKHAIYSFDSMPKSALQKAIRRINREASERVAFESPVNNPNTYRRNGRSIHLNTQTRRIMAATAIRQ